MQVFLFYLFSPKKPLEGIGYWKVPLLGLLLGFQFHLCAFFQLQEKQESGTWCKLLLTPAGYQLGTVVAVEKNETKQKQAVHYYVLSVIHVLSSMSNMTVIIITVYYSTEWVLHKSLEGVLFESDQLQTTGTPGGAVNMSWPCLELCVIVTVHKTKYLFRANRRNYSSVFFYTLVHCLCI